MESFAKKENMLKNIWAQEGGCSHPSPPRASANDGGQGQPPWMKGHR